VRRVRQDNSGMGWGHGATITDMTECLSNILNDQVTV